MLHPYYFVGVHCLYRLNIDLTHLKGVLFIVAYFNSVIK